MSSQYVDEDGWSEWQPANNGYEYRYRFEQGHQVWQNRATDEDPRSSSYVEDFHNLSITSSHQEEGYTVERYPEDNHDVQADSHTAQGKDPVYSVPLSDPAYVQEYEGEGDDGDDDDVQAAIQASRAQQTDRPRAGQPSHSAYSNYETDPVPPPVAIRAKDIKHDSGTRSKDSSKKTKKNEVYQVHDSKEFYVGRVFKVYWAEPRGALRNTTWTTCKHMLNGQNIHAGLRRFIVVAQFKGHSQVVPITTYSNQGCTKQGVHPEYHGIVYDASSKPYRVQGEPDLPMKPIGVDMDAHETLTTTSRINYAKTSTLEHNCRVRIIGTVSARDIESLLENCDVPMTAHHA